MPFIAVQSSDEKEILQGNTNRAYIFSNFVGIFTCLTVSVHFFALQYGILVPRE